MTNESIQCYLDPDPGNRDYAWFDQSITLLRRDLRPIVNRAEAAELRRILDSRQSMKKIQDSFDDVNFKRDTKFKPLAFMNVFVNSMTEDLKKAPPRAEVRAQDPSSEILRGKELEKLRNRKILERDRTMLQQRVMGPDSQYKIPYDKFQSNIKEFDDMGLDEADPDDVNFFGTNIHKLDFETGAQELVNAVMKIAKFDQVLIQKYVRDAMAVNCVCGQTYVDQVTGAIKQDYIYPEDYFFIPSDEEDGHNDIAKGWLKSVTLAEFLSKVGNSFNWNTDWPYLVWAMNYCNNTKYTGFMRSGLYYDCCGNPEWMGKGGVGHDWQSNMCDWSTSLQYKVFMGYTEWLCPEATATFLKKKGTEEAFPIPYNYQLQERSKKKSKKNKTEDTGYYANEYEKESWYQWTLYSSYYLTTSSTSQYLFNFGKVYHALMEGANDEYARYTCWSFRNQGRSMAEIGETLVEAGNFAWYRLLWILYKAKPEEDQFLINEVIEVAKGLQQQFNQQGTNQTQVPVQSILDQVIQYQRQKNIRIRAYPRIDGREIGQLPPLKNENRGIDPLSTFMLDFTTIIQQMIANQIGFNPMRVGANPPSRESFKTEQSTLEASYNSTGYVGRMIQYLKEHQATVSLLYAQDICLYKDSVPYKWMQTMIGERQTNAIGLMEKIAAHRMATFVEDITDVVSREDVKQAATLALQQKLITFEQWFVVTQTKNTLRAAQLLTYLQRKAEKKLRRQQIEDLQMQDQINKNMHDRKMEELAFERETKYGVADRDANAFIGSAMINKEAKINTQELKEAGNIPKEQAKTQGKIQQDTNKANLENQKVTQ